MTPGRRLTLTLGVPVLLALIGAIALNIVAQVGRGSFPVHVSIPVSDGKVTAQIGSGDITLRQAQPGSGPENAAELTGTARYSLVRANLTTSGSTVRFGCPLPMGTCDLSATLQVPAQTAVSLSTGGGDATVPGFTASRLTLNTDGGSLSAGHLTGILDLTSGGGDVSITRLDGLEVLTNTDGGDLSVGRIVAQRATITSGGGDVSVVFTKAPHNLQINSDGGNVALVLPRGQYKVYTNADGGDVANAAGDDPSAANSIVVDSGGGNIAILERG
jgi:putative adhesin